MANGLLDGIFDNPLLALGTGLLAASGPSPVPVSFGQALASGLDRASTMQQGALRNEFLREGLRGKQAAREAAARRRQAIIELQEVLGVGGRAPGPQLASASDPVSLLRGFPGIRAEDFAVIDESGAVPGVSGPGVGQPGGPPTRRQLLGLLAEAAPDQFTKSALDRLFPAPQKPTTLEREFNFLRSQGVPRDKALESLREGTVIHVGDGKADQPISITDLENIRLPNGTTPPIGTTYKEAKAAGARVLSSEEITTNRQADSAAAILTELEELAIGSEGRPGIFAQVEPGFVNRAKSALDFALDWLEQGDPRVSRFQDLGQGSIASFVRMLGEKGALAEGDVDRALGLLPRIFPLPDTGEVAKDKIATLRGIINQGIANLNGTPAATGGNGGVSSAGGGDVRRFRYDPASGGLVPVE